MTSQIPRDPETAIAEVLGPLKAMPSYATPEHNLRFEQHGESFTVFFYAPEDTIMERLLGTMVFTGVLRDETGR